MKLATVVLALAAGCGGDPLRADVDTFCNAAEATGSKSIVEIGPYVASRLKTDEFKDLFVVLKGTGDLGMLVGKIRDVMKRTGVESCPTLELFVSKPRP